MSIIQTLAKANDAGYLTKLPSITPQQVRKYPPRSEVTVNVHLKYINQGLKYAQIPPPRINNATDTASSIPTSIEEYDSDDDQTPAPNPSTTTPANPSPTSQPAQLPTTTPNGNVLADDIIEKLIKPSNHTNYIYSY